MTWHENLPNRIKNLTLSRQKPLVPLFEAIMNSIHAINDRNITEGKIDIHIVRDNQQQALSEDVIPLEAVTGFEITDNGIGFTETNYNSFCTADTPLKRNIGGKGVGRLTWLKAFERAEVSSTFESNGSLQLREFRFRATEDGIENDTLVAVNGEATPQTTVRLIKYRKEFECRRKTETIALHIIEHFLQFFAFDNCPIMRLHDQREDEPTVLNTLYHDGVKLEDTTTKLKVNGHSLEVRHCRLSSKITKNHRLHFCADNRPVASEDAARFVANLHEPLTDPENDEKFAYAAYVSGRFLNNAADQTRNLFDIPRADNLMAGEKETTWEDLIGAVAQKAGKFLDVYTAPIRFAKVERIREYAKKSPKYRPLVKHKAEWLDEIPVGVTDDELDVRLYQLNQRYDAELRIKGMRLQSRKSQLKLPSYKARLEHFLEEWNEAGHAKLCDYVVHRKAVLDFLNDCLKQKVSTKFELEDIIHDTIFPMRTTSDDVDVTQSNLWVIDERLSYHHYLASDKPFTSTKPVKVPPSAKKKRTDLITFHSFDRFDTAIAIVESQPFDAITIIEFKRPSRDDYTAKDNPINQTEEYVQLLRSGKAKDKHGQFIPVRKNTQFYSYIICTITPTLRELAERYLYYQLPDGEGYFKMHPNFRLYSEIIDYGKLFRDAAKRNQSFFEQMNML